MAENLITTNGLNDINVDNADPQGAAGVAERIGVIEAPDALSEAAKDASEHEKYLGERYTEDQAEIARQDQALAELMQNPDFHKLDTSIDSGAIANPYALRKFVEAVHKLNDPDQSERYTAGYKANESMNLNSGTDPELQGIYTTLSSGEMGFDDLAGKLYEIPELKTYADIQQDPSASAADITKAFADAYKRAFRDYGYLKDNVHAYEASHS